MQERKYYHYSMQEAGAEMHVAATHEDGSLTVSGFERHDDSGWFYFCFEAFTFCEQIDMSKAAILQQMIDHETDGYSEGSYSTLAEAMEVCPAYGSDDNVQFIFEHVKEA